MSGHVAARNRRLGVSRWPAQRTQRWPVELFLDDHVTSEGSHGTYGRANVFSVVLDKIERPLRRVEGRTERDSVPDRVPLAAGREIDRGRFNDWTLVALSSHLSLPDIGRVDDGLLRLAVVRWLISRAESTSAIKGLSWQRLVMHALSAAVLGPRMEIRTSEIGVSTWANALRFPTSWALDSDGLAKESLLEVAEDASPPWFHDSQAGPDKSATPRVIMALFTGIRSMIEADHFGELDHLLATAATDRMSPVGMVGLLRYSFSVRDRLPTWGDLRTRVRQELEVRGMDVESVLRGLYVD